MSTYWIIPNEFKPGKLTIKRAKEDEEPPPGAVNQKPLPWGSAVDVWMRIDTSKVAETSL